MRPTWITEVTAEPLDLPLIEPFTIATGTQLAAHNVLVRLKLADGTTGLGEAAPFPAVSGETQEGDLAAIVAARPHLLGRDARSWRTIAGLLADLLPGAASARCGIEMALLDALSRHYHQPLCVFFGGGPAPLHTDITITAGTAAEAAAAARSITARGFSAIKVKVGALSPEALSKAQKGARSERRIGPRRRPGRMRGPGLGVRAGLPPIKPAQQRPVPRPPLPPRPHLRPRHPTRPRFQRAIEASA